MWDKSPSIHINLFVMAWKENKIPKEEWVHSFIYTLDIVPSNWYV